MDKKCIVLGDGPAGITAAIYLKRANKNVIIISIGESNLLKADKIDNYYGFENGISGKDLYQNGINQAKNLGIEVIYDEVLNLSFDGRYMIECLKETFYCEAVIMATGNKKKSPNIKGINEYEGLGISYCAICDGFFYRKKKIGVLGHGEYALHEASVLKHLTDNLIIYTNGKKLESNEFEICEEKILEVNGDGHLQNIVLASGITQEIQGLFIADGSASSNALAQKVGVLMDDGKIIVNEKMETNLPGFYSCGDATSGLLQISKAVYQGTVAGIEAGKYLNRI